MKYDFTSIMDRHGKDAIAVDGLGTGFAPAAPKEGFDAIPMWVADMNFPTVPTIQEAIIERTNHPAFGYFNPTDEYFDSIIRWQAKRNGVQGLTKECIGYENGVLGGVISALNCVCSRGDKILIHSPTYMGFTLSLKNNGYEAVHSPLVKDENGVWRMDFEDMEKHLKEEKIHAAIMCNPHNPCGRVWERWELEKAMELYKKYDVYVVSDEIWSDIILSGNKHIPTQSVSEDARQRTAAFYAPSKTFNLAGMATSNLFIPDPEMRRKFRSELLDVGQENMNRLGLFACRAAYEGGGEWLDQLIGYLAGNLALVRDFCKNRVPQIQLVEPEGTYLAWLDCRELGMTDDELMAFFSDDAKVWLDPGTHSGEQGSGFMRFNLGSSRSVIAQALDQIEAAWKKRNA